MTSPEEPTVYTTENRQEEARGVQDTEFWMRSRLFPEVYGQHIDEMMKEVGDIEQVVSQFEKENKLTPQTATELLDQLRIYPEKILRLDENAEKAGVAVHTEKREALVERMTVLRRRLLMEKEKNEQGARDVYRAIKTRYDAVQHTLTLDQRREMRVKIATLSSLVQRAEDKRLASVGSAILAAVSYATEHAPAVAHAASVDIKKQTSVTAKKSVLAVLVGAFRLK